MGCGQPAGEAGFNVARVAAVLAGLDNVPGVTVNRYCSSSLQTIRMAAHAIKAGEGDVFIAAGVETVSRYRYGASDTGSHNAAFADAEARTAARAPAVTRPVDAVRGRPARRLHRDGPDRRERRRAREGEPRGDGRVRAPLPDPRRREPGERVLRARDHPGDAARRHRRHDATTGRAPDTTLEGLAAAQAGVPRGRPGDRGQRLPAQRRRRGRRRHERHQGRASSASPRSRASSSSGVTGLDPEIMGLGPVEACRQALRAREA